MNAEAHQPMTLQQLIDALDRFVSDSRHHREVEIRWLATQAEEFRLLAISMRNGRPSNDALRAIGDFRLAELAAEKDRLKSQSDALDREAQTLRAARNEAAA
jgi:hypothetical protein